jgi:hypothetical protein
MTTGTEQHQRAIPPQWWQVTVIVIIIVTAAPWVGEPVTAAALTLLTVALTTLAETRPTA